MIEILRAPTAGKPTVAGSKSYVDELMAFLPHEGAAVNGSRFMLIVNVKLRTMAVFMGCIRSRFDEFASI